MTNFEEKTKEELEKNFIESFERLCRANRLFDKGHLSEAPRISSEICVLVYDNGSTKSILKSIEKKEIFFIDSSDQRFSPNQENGFISTPNYMLVVESISFDGMEYSAPLSMSKEIKKIDFSGWWNGLALGWRGRKLDDISRKEIILFYRNKEGGAHVDDKLHTSQKKFLNLIRGEYISGHMELGNSEPLEPIDGPGYPTVRQIGWELEETLLKELPELTAKAATEPIKGPRMRPAKKL